MSDLIVVEEHSAADIYRGDGLDVVVENIRKQTSIVGLDVEKKKDRDFMRSSAANIAKAKTKLDAMGKSLTEEWKAKSKVVDASRKAMREKLDALKEEVRAPLTEYENREKLRIEKLDAVYDLIVNLGKIYCADTDTALSVSELEGNIKQLNEITIDESLAERELDCIKAHRRSIEKLETTIAGIKKAEEQAAELERLRLKQEQEDKEKREAEIAEQAAEQARQEAAKAIIEQQEAAEKAAKEAAEREAKAKQDAIDAKAKAKQEAEQAELRLKKQAEQAEIDKQAAIKAEQKRQADEVAKQEKEAAEREANKSHKKKVNNEAKQSFIDAGMTEENAKLAVTLLAKRVINHCQINY